MITGIGVGPNYQAVFARPNVSPTVANALVDQVATESSLFTYQFASNSFTDGDGDTLTYTTSTLPSWLTFTAATRTFSGTPAGGDVGTATITVTANDGTGRSVSDAFDIVTSAAAATAPFQANMVMWLDAQTEVYADGTALAGANTWHDRSSGGRHVVAGQNTLTFKSPGLINSKKCVRFASNTYGSHAASESTDGLSGQTTYVIAVVARYAVGTGDTYLFGSGNGAVAGVFGWETGSRCRFAGTWGGPYFTTGPLLAAMQDTNRRVILRVTGGQATLFVDGVKYDTIATSGSTNMQFVGGWTNGTPSRFFIGDMGEAIVYVKDCSDANITTIDDYLKAHWGL